VLTPVADHGHAFLSRYRRSVREARLPYVRLYAVLLIAVMLLYTVVNPQFLGAAEVASLATIMGCAVLLAGGYAMVTFWPQYGDVPMIDFAALLALSVLITSANLVLFEHLIDIHEDMHAVGVFNRLAITAFAAMVLAGYQRLFAIWIAADFALFCGFTLPLQGVDAGMWYALLSYLSGAIIMLAINFAMDRWGRAAFAASEALDRERARNEEMVLNMLPRAAVERIKEGRMVADSYADASVIFIDMAGFTALSRRVSPGHLVDLLNGFFSHADRCAAELGVEKVKTVGDAYLAITGANLPCENSADHAIAFAEAVIAGIPELSKLAGVEISLRAGVHSGPVVGGVIGASRMAYDYWGDTVNVAARLEGTAPVNGIAISESTWLRTRQRERFGPPSVIPLKGVGEINVFHSVPLARGTVDPGDAAQTGVAAAA
jgi:class 3 adenylate cyclase